MKTVLTSKCNISAVFLTVLFIVGCTPLIGAYSPTAYKNATSLKAETLAIMLEANEPFNDHKASIDSLNVELSKAYEFVNGFPSNSISAQQWAILINKDGDLLGKFFTRWEERDKLSDVLIIEFKSIISDAFDEIICLEANKEKAADCSNKGDG